MYVEDMSLGDKVVPISKTIMVGDDPAKMVNPESSVAWRIASYYKQPYLFVVGTTDILGQVKCAPTPEPFAYDVFMDYDLEEYNEV